MSNLGTAGQARAAALLRGQAAAPFAAPFSVGLGLSASRDGLTGEPTGGGYARQPVSLGGTGAAVSNTNALSFGPFSADLGVVRALAVFDATGAVMWQASLSGSLTLPAGATRTIAIGAITASLD